MDAGADIDKAMDDGATPLLIACQNGHLDVVRALMDAEEVEDTMLSAAVITAGLQNKPRVQLTKEEEARAFNYAAVAPATVNDVVHRMIGNISVYFDEGDGNNYADTRYWDSLALYFEMLSQHDAQEVSKWIIGAKVKEHEGRSSDCDNSSSINGESQECQTKAAVQARGLSA